MQTCVGFANGFLSVGSWVLNTLWTKAMGGASDRGALLCISFVFDRFWVQKWRHV